MAAGVTVALTAALMLTIAFAFLAARPVLGYLFSRFCYSVYLLY